MSTLYDWAADQQFGTSASSTSPPMHPDTTNSWNQEAFEARRRQVGVIQPVQINQVTGHALDCACPRCPGWYAERALAAQAPIAPDRRPNPLTDQVVPVSILMAVFTICAVVLLPVIAPILALTAVSLALVVVALVVVVLAALVLLAAYGRTRNDIGQSAPRIVKGRVLRHRM